MAQNREFRGVARAVHTDAAGACHYLYHRTAVVAVHPNGAITLNSGGWRSTTTKLAMNQASNEAGLGFHVFARNRDWFVAYRGHEIPFVDGMLLNEDRAKASDETKARRSRGPNRGGFAVLAAVGDAA